MTAQNGHSIKPEEDCEYDYRCWIEVNDEIGCDEFHRNETNEISEFKRLEHDLLYDVHELTLWALVSLLQLLVAGDWLSMVRLGDLWMLDLEAKQAHLESETKKAMRNGTKTYG